MTIEQAIEQIYTSIHNNNQDLDTHIAALKVALKEKGVTEAVFDPARLVQSNREGRKLMQSYFKKRGVIVTFAGTNAA
jgi:hypothetical protein